MAERKRVLDKIRSQVGLATSDLGFKFDRKEKLLARITNKKYDVISIIAAYYGDVVQIRCAAWVGVEEMESIARHTKFYGFPPPYSFSVSVPVWGDGHQLDFRESVDIEQLVRRLTNDIQNTAIPFFDRYTSTSDVDSSLNESPSISSTFSPNWTHRCASGTIAAHLCRRTNYTDVVAQYRDRLTSWSKGFYLPAYDNLLARLEAL